MYHLYSPFTILTESCSSSSSALPILGVDSDAAVDMDPSMFSSLPSDFALENNLSPWMPSQNPSTSSHPNPYSLQSTPLNSIADPLVPLLFPPSYARGSMEVDKTPLDPIFSKLPNWLRDQALEIAVTFNGKSEDRIVSLWGTIELQLLKTRVSYSICRAHLGLLTLLSSLEINGCLPLEGARMS